MPPTFGKRGLVGAPKLQTPPKVGVAPKRRLRSNVVAAGAAGLIVFGATGVTGYQQYRCWPPSPGQPDLRPQWCFNHGSGHSSAGHGWGFSSSRGGGVGHASFGGFGAHGSGHGGGS